MTDGPRPRPHSTGGRPRGGHGQGSERRRSDGERQGRGKPERDRGAGGARTTRPLVHLPDDVVAELKHTARPGKGEILVQLFAEAATAFAEEDFAEAIKLGEQAKHIALRATGPRELLGLAYYRAERYKEAARELAAFRRISGSTEQNPVIADCYRAMGKPDKAIEYVDEMERTVPPAVHFEGEIVASSALADTGRLDEAIARMERLDLGPANAEEHHLRAWYVLGDLLERKGRFTQSRSYFESVAAADPDLTDAPDRIRRLGQAFRTPDS